MAVGTLVDWVWTLDLIGACPNDCRPSGYLVGPLDQLRLYLDGTVVRVFGTLACGSVEGCAIIVDHFDTLGCDTVVPVRPTTWGRLHAIYR